jgi:hypothetical protein
VVAPPPPPPVEKAVEVAVGAATAVALPKSPQSVKLDSAPPAPVAPPAGSHDKGGSSSGGISLLAILLGLVLVYVVGRLGFGLWRRRTERHWQEVSLTREADWEAVLDQIEVTAASAASGPGAKRPRRSKVGADSGSRGMQTGATSGRGRSEGTAVKAR